MRSHALAAALLLAVTGCSKSGGDTATTPTPSPTPTGSPTLFEWTDPGFSEPAGSENYQCFFVDVPTGTGVGATKFSYSSTSLILHHMVIFTTSDTSQPNGSSQDCTANPFNTNWEIRYAGGVGTGALTLPAGVAVSVAGPTQRFVFQLHLLNASASPVIDDTTVDITFTPPGTNFTHAQLLVSGATGFSVPPNMPYSLTSHCVLPAIVPSVNLIAVWPHMHKIGTQFRIDLTPAGGSPSTLLDWPWNFGSQPMYTLTNGLMVKGGDEIDTTCSWNNTTGSPISYGESSTQEMCFDFFYYYPAVLDQMFPCGDQLGTF